MPRIADNKIADREFQKLAKAHDRQIVRKGAFPGNYGWVADGDAFLSKTDKGILSTRRVARGKYDHEWSTSDGIIIIPPDDRWDYRERLRSEGLIGAGGSA